MNTEPKSVTAQRGIDSRNPVLLTASIISWGITVVSAEPIPTVRVKDEMIP